MLVDSIRHAAALSDVPPPHRPWLPALPAIAAGRRACRHRTRSGSSTCPPSSAAPRCGGRRATATWRCSALAASGTTTALRSLVAAACNDRPRRTCTSTSSTPAATSGSTGSPPCRTVPVSCDRTSASGWPGCCAGSSASSIGDGAARTTGGPRSSWPSTACRRCAPRSTRPRDAAEHDALQRIVAEGAGVGIACVITAERPGAVPSSMLAACADRWLFHLDDPSEATACGIPPPLVPPAVARSCRRRLDAARGAAGRRRAAPPSAVRRRTGGHRRAAARRVGRRPAGRRR